MCTCLGKRTTKYLGIFLLIIFIVISMGSFIMAATSSKTYNSKYNPNVLQGFNSYILACAGLLFLFSFLGIVALYNDSKFLTVIFQIIWIVLFVLTFIVAIMALLLGTTKELDNFKCAKDANATATTKLDDYLINVDQAFCSDNCVCNIKDISTYKNVPASVLIQWRFDSKSGAQTFADCTSAVRNSTYASAKVNPGDLSRNGNDTNLDIELFLKTWKWVEETYNCVGFCDSSFTNNKNVTTQYYKYLFSDVNRVYNSNNTKACFNIIFEDTAKFFSSNGLYILLASIYMFLIFVIACAWCCAPDIVEFNPDSRAIMIINPNPSKV